jgi:amino acid transporter
VFIVATITSVDWSLLSFSDYPPFSDIVASVALTFFAFLGFSVITFSAGDLADPARGLPRAMYTALGLAGGRYILIAVGVFGTLPVDEVVGYGETAMAEAARPSLGDAGFVMMAIAAVLATTSSVNATPMPRAPSRGCSPRSGSSRPCSGAGSTARTTAC